MKKIAVIGICGISVFLKGKKIPLQGESQIFDEIHSEIGGKGVNSAITIARLGGNVNFLTAVGNDEIGNFCLQNLEKENVNTTCLIKDKQTDYGVILTDYVGNNTVSVFKGASNLLTTDDVDNFTSQIAESDYLLLQAELNDEVLLKASEIAIQNDVKIIFDPSPVRQLPNIFVERVWLFTPNRIEEKYLIDNYHIDNFITTLDKNGAALHRKNDYQFFHAKPVSLVCSTGAGDVFNGALLVALSEEKTLEQSIEYAIRASAFKVSHDYVLEGIPYKKDLY